MDKVASGFLVLVDNYMNSLTKVLLIGAGVVALGAFAYKGRFLEFQAVPVTSLVGPRPTIGESLRIYVGQPPVGTNLAGITSSCNYFEPFLEVSFSQGFAANKQMSFQHNCTATYGNYGPLFPNVIQNAIEISPAGQILQHVLQIWNFPNSIPTEAYNRAFNITNGGFLKAGSKLRFWERSNTGTFLAGVSLYDPNKGTWSSHTIPIPPDYGKIRWTEFDMVSQGGGKQSSDGYYFATNTTSGTIVYQGYSIGTGNLIPIQPPGQLDYNYWCNYEFLTNEGSNMGYDYPTQTTNTKVTQNFSPTAVIGVGGGGCNASIISLTGQGSFTIATIAVSWPRFTGTLSYARASNPGTIIGYIPMNSGYGSFQWFHVRGAPADTIIIENNCSITVNF